MCIDKLYHFIAGAIIFWVASYFMACPIIPVIVIGALKEVYDRVIKHIMQIGGIFLLL